MGNRMIGVIVGAVAVQLAGTMYEAAGQDSFRPAYQAVRFEEDWSAFEPPKDGAGDRYDPIKNIHLSERLRLSLGGDARVRLEDWSNFGFGRENDDSFILYRAFLHGDLRYGRHLRVFVQTKHAAVTDRGLPGGNREILDMDDVDFWNTFVESRVDAGPTQLMARLGRQELLFGKQRLVSPLDWANNRRIFDGVRTGVYGADRRWTLDGFWTRPVTIDHDDLNEPDDDREFAGLYFTIKSVGPVGLDTYLLYLENEAIDQRLYTAGGRVFGRTSFGLTYDLEAAFQFGDTGGLDHRAWMLAVEAAYTWEDRPWTPWIGAGFDYASGDSNPADGNVGTFNQLFPLGHAYLGYIDTVGRQNIVGIRASAGVTMPVSKPIRLKADLHHFRLADEDDALYNAGGGIVRAGGTGEEAVGFELDITAAMQLTRHTGLTVGHSTFFPGALIDETGSDAIVRFIYLQVQYRF